MNSTLMIQRIIDRTHMADEKKIVGELNSAKDWAFSKMFASENGPDQLMTFDLEFTLAALSRNIDIGSYVTSDVIYGVKALWLKLSADRSFTPMVRADPSDARFQFADQWSPADTTNVAVGHPVMYDVVNMSKIRVAPAIPAGATIRLDYWRRPPDVSMSEQLYGDDVPEPLHEAIVDKATAQILDILDDTRAQRWEIRAERRVTEGLYVLQRRAEGPSEIKPFHRTYRRW